MSLHHVPLHPMSAKIKLSQEWTQLFENEMLLAALIDRIAFRSFVLNMNCSLSYRIDSTLNHDEWLKIFYQNWLSFLLTKIEICPFLYKIISVETIFDCLLIYSPQLLIFFSVYTLFCRFNNIDNFLKLPIIWMNIHV